MTTTELIQIISGFAGSIGFALLFNIRGKKLMAAAAGGLLSWILFIIISKFTSSEPVAYFLIACILSRMSWNSLCISLTVFFSLIF